MQGIVYEKKRETGVVLVLQSQPHLHLLALLLDKLCSRVDDLMNSCCCRLQEVDQSKVNQGGHKPELIQVTLKMVEESFQLVEELLVLLEMSRLLLQVLAAKWNVIHCNDIEIYRTSLSYL